MNLSFKVDMNSEVFEIFDRFANIDPTPFYELIATHPDPRYSMAKEAVASYKKAWGTDRLTKATTVYSAVKIAAFEERRRGFLTLSTMKAMSLRIDRTTGASVGIMGSKTWPSEEGEAIASISDVLDELSEVWSMDNPKADWSPNRWSRRQAIRKGLPNDEVEIKWGSEGFSIKWPPIAKRALRLRDIEKNTEDIMTKKYYANKQEKFFLMTSAFMDRLRSEANRYLWTVIIGGKDFDTVMGVGKKDVRAGGGSKLFWEEAGTGRGAGGRKLTGTVLNKVTEEEE